MGSNMVSTIFAISWAILFVLGLLIFRGHAPVGLKRKLWAPFTIGSAILFVLFSSLLLRGRLPWFFYPFVVLIVFLNLRNTRFCETCGSMQTSRDLISRPRFCQKCGHDLTALHEAPLPK